MSPDDINLLRGLVTVVSFIGFVALVWHSWSRKRSAEHAEAAALPFQEEQGVNRE
ncbi:MULTISPECIES: cbb3-type cytochrome c oxidase subunit 3 [Inhella]|uniref:CcoQ/FixQ family Cbb3-type cytochrome c oxidase assembly chaperone n=1 Tax=Inhella proteolytica TaxID=2795029 RepID=A0A931J4F3_9BURK|nr:cbb3-type cytochrome c oxidase subunit 3 [Inhella proteolytica]MBH9578543.1 CcoQ/FixQ family Cbb3-type cytochrome c oxidase assembly chaperone [Inhella proteolytica]